MDRLSIATLPPAPFSWEKCIFCQQGGTRAEPLVNPSKNIIVSRRNQGYVSVAPHLTALRQYSWFRLPSGHRIDCLDDGPGIEATLGDREALYHKSCWRDFLPPKVDKILAQLMAEEVEMRAVASSTTTNPEQSSTADDSKSTTRLTRSSAPAVAAKSELCFICCQPATRMYPLHQCETTEVEQRVKHCATVLGDSHLLSQMLTYGDLIAQEAKYHTKCLAYLYSKARRAECTTQKDFDGLICESLAFADLISYVTRKISESVNHVFVMADLVRFYEGRLESAMGAGADLAQRMHSTRLREKILARIPELREQKSGRDYLLIHSEANLKQNIDRDDQDDSAIGFHYFVKNLRKSMSQFECKFNGEFPPDVEEESVPQSLLSAVSMLMYGSRSSKKCGATRPALTIAQLILLNFRATAPQGEIVRQQRQREPPFPMYIALRAYGYSRDKAMIDELHRLGLSVSHNRIMEVTAQFCRLVVKRADEEGILCPANLRKNMMVIVAYDNIDFKSSSTTSRKEFHGTGLTIFQVPSESSVTEPRSFRTAFGDVERPGDRGIPLLPDSYAFVSESFAIQDKIEPAECSVPGSLSQHMKPTDEFSGFWLKEKSWLQHIHEQIISDGLLENISWGAFHATRESFDEIPGLNALLPLFEDKSSSPGMIRHGMDIAMRTTEFLNPGQPTVLCMDQQLYAPAKKLQWSRPELYGENRVVMLLGGFHIEKAFLCVLGQLLEKSGWTHIVASSGIMQEGSAMACLKVTNVLRSRVIYQKTAAALYSLLVDAYEEHDPDHELTLEQWVQSHRKKCPTFAYWLLVLDLVILLLTFVRSIRQKNFELYTKCLVEMLPWFFVFDHQNYSRWLSVHVKDLLQLQHTAPVVHAQFKAGNFVFNRTGNPFSSLAIDQAHEQNNAILKDSGGVVGLTEDAASLRRVTIAGPEITRLLHEFQSADVKSPSGTGKHHEQYTAYQQKFKNHVSSLKNSFNAMQNPFCDLSSDLMTLDTREAVGPEGVRTLTKLEEIGKEKYFTFVENRLICREQSLYANIPKSSVKIFASRKKASQPNRDQVKLLQVKEDSMLYWRLYVTSVARHLDLNKFFEYENQNYPPALTSQGEMRHCDKAELVKILERLVDGSLQPTVCDGLVVDIAALVHQVPPRAGLKNFKDYFQRQLVPHVEHLARSVQATRIDFVTDLYSGLSTKSGERQSRGSGVRRKDLPEKDMLPSNWTEYLRNASNKMELFKYLSLHFLETLKGFKVVTNVNKSVETRRVPDTFVSHQHLEAMEEADARLLTHAMDMAKHGVKSVLIRASDTDVVVLGISFFHRLAGCGLEELWILYGSGRNMRYIALHSINAGLGPQKSEALRGFHAFTRCDSTSAFAGCGKPKAWQTWQQHEKVTTAFVDISNPLLTVPENVFQELEEYTVRLFDPKSTLKSVNLARKELFVQKGCSLHTIPPTAAALRQHVLRSAYQAGHLWGVALHRYPQPPPPISSWGWRMVDGEVVPYWTHLPHMWDACRALSVCGCKSQCETQRCSCRSNNLPCCPGCKNCKGKCRNNSLAFEEDISEEDIIYEI